MNRPATQGPTTDGQAPSPAAAPPAGPPDAVTATVRQGDCVTALAGLPAGSVDLVIADPPYNIGYDYDQYDDRRSGEDYEAWCVAWGREVRRVLADDGAFWLVIGDEYAAELKVAMTRQVGFHLRNWVVWYYTFGVHCRQKFTRSHAHLLYFVRDAKRFTFNKDAVAVPSARQLVYNDRRADPKGRTPDDTWVLRPQDLDTLGDDAEAPLWYVPRVAGTFKERTAFPCQLPELLLARIIGACSHPGGHVLDPFAGSGSTLVTAKKLGRHSTGIELSADYVAAIEERLAATSVGQPLSGSLDPRTSAPRTPATPPAKGRRAAGAKRKP